MECSRYIVFSHISQHSPKNARFVCICACCFILFVVHFSLLYVNLMQTVRSFAFSYIRVLLSIPSTLHVIRCLVFISFASSSCVSSRSPFGTLAPIRCKWFQTQEEAVGKRKKHETNTRICITKDATDNVCRTLYILGWVSLRWRFYQKCKNKLSLALPFLCWHLRKKER